MYVKFLPTLPWTNAQGESKENYKLYPGFKVALYTVQRSKILIYIDLRLNDKLFLFSTQE